MVVSESVIFLNSMGFNLVCYNSTKKWDSCQLSAVSG